MQTTVAIEVSSEGDAATRARAASGIAVANGYTPDEAGVPKASSGAASAVLTAQSCQECTSNDIDQPAPP